MLPNIAASPGSNRERRSAWHRALACLPECGRIPIHRHFPPIGAACILALGNAVHWRRHLTWVPRCMSLLRDAASIPTHFDEQHIPEVRLAGVDSIAKPESQPTGIVKLD